VLFRDNELLRGVLDKSQFGASQYGLVDAVYELYGADHASMLLSSLGRLFTLFIQSAGFTCGMDDLVLTEEAEAKRRELINTAELKGLKEAAKALDIDATDVESRKDEVEAAVRAKLQSKLLHDPTGANSAAMDHAYRAVTSPLNSDIISICLPGGLYKPFPVNMFSTMVASGAKGSLVNHSQISCGLGQQSLEGRRVPVMISGRTLPSFAPYDSNPRAGGFIADRFLTGVRPQDYYFHCMAGREGLVDTAVKTSRSG
jgi:DNA-directed RNA polymerase I subunit RPA1